MFHVLLLYLHLLLLLLVIEMIFQLFEQRHFLIDFLLYSPFFAPLLPDLHSLHFLLLQPFLYAFFPLQPFQVQLVLLLLSLHQFLLQLLLLQLLDL